MTPSTLLKFKKRPRPSNPDAAARSRKKRRDNGLCIACPNPSPDTVRCPGCAERSRAQHRAWRAAKIAAGLCGWCGKRPLYDQNKCGVCMGVDSDSVREHEQRREAEHTKQVVPWLA